MKLECKLRTAVSKSGNEYVYMSVMIGTYEKKVFLTEAEKALLHQFLENPQK